ncbi:ribosomal RNA-processing protein 7 [Cocos nucifera]|uniref:Ribosomal RNA-processing protein 7 n=1 Tax=Cocos nucifera TaxID=13894 RepID=A0A8K0IH38_COCNU|nr:ribosomal RNA-processing protein 7 [Cocos nucifera]
MAPAGAGNVKLWVGLRAAWTLAELITMSGERKQAYRECLHQLEQKPTKPDKKKEKHKLAILKKRIHQNKVDPRCGDQLPQKDEQCIDPTNGEIQKESGSYRNSTEGEVRKEFSFRRSSIEGGIRKVGSYKNLIEGEVRKEFGFRRSPTEGGIRREFGFRRISWSKTHIDPLAEWLTSYKENRPGLKVLQQRIDEFITAYEVQQEQERKEREARVAGGGWTVVVHHKGRKKTTDSETGITVGSVAQAAVMDKMAKKKKEVAVDFYRFQRREAQRNEVMMLRSKFEQDKKRIRQLRAARKFRPY